jgi:hypothetical protein
MSYYSSIYGNSLFFNGIRPKKTIINSFSNLKSILFDGINDYISLGEPSDVSVTLSSNELTISAWIKPFSLSAQGYIVAKADPFVGPVIHYIMGVGVDGSMFGYFGGGGGFSVSGAASAITTNVWYHVLWTVKNVSGTNKGSIWLNGVQQGGTVTAGAMTDSGTELRIGAGNAAGNAALPFSGYIDEVTFWNTGFTSSQVTSLYNSGHPASPNSHSASANLLHWFRMGDNDTYPVILDNKGNVSGTMTNMAVTSITTTVP